MKVVAIRARALSIPFRQSFRHASAERASGQSMWVEVALEGGLCGYGEGCPREYVTGETTDACLAFVARHEASWRRAIGDVASLAAWVDAQRALIDCHPAAWSAVELALLDAFARAAGQSVEQALGLPELRGEFCYSAVIGDASPARFTAELARYVEAGFAQFKIKLSGDLARDSGKVTALREAGIAPQAVRADANNLWADAAGAIAYLSALDYPFRAIEEPLGVRDLAGQARLAASCACAIILDESVLNLDDLAALAAPTAWVVNLRISKMGGLLRSLQMVAALRRAGLAMVIGAHVGETSVLTRAALTVANASRDILSAQEGAFGTHLLAHDVVAAPIMFGAGGILRSTDVPRGSAGFGLDVCVVDRVD